MEARPSSEVNAAYYAEPAPGRARYWHKMAAPRLRVDTLLRLLRERPPQRLVDLGCGDGRLLSEVRRQHDAAQLLGIDLSEAQIRANAAQARDVDWLALNLERPETLPPQLFERFDTLVAAELVEHLERPAELLRGARALAAPGARLLLSTQSGPVRTTERRVGHHRHYSRAQIEELLRTAGWQPLRVWNCGFPFHDLSKWVANLRPEVAIRRFGERAYGPLENLACLVLRLLFRFNSGSRGAQLFAVAERAA